jgi:leucyl aminopeptidase
MPYPVLEFTDQPTTEIAADAVLFLLPWGDPADDASTSVRAAADAVGASRSAGAVTRVSVPELVSLPAAVVAVGDGADAAASRFAAGAGIRTLTGFETVAIVPLGGTAAHARAIAEGATLGGYRFDSYKKNAPGRVRANRVLIAAPGTDDDAAFAAAVGEASALVKDLVTTPAEWLGPADLADAARAAVEGLPVEVTVWDEDALRAGGFGGILGVGQGSVRPPRLVRVDYSPADATGHVALVGKGITFDTGGLSLKPAGSMVGMKYDMCGAATVLAVARAAARLAVPVRVTAWLCIADNMPSGSATRPGDVLRIADGQTVEVLNTDAEGRLVLADGLVAASRENPDLIVDVATLTGAITTALGTRHTGVMGEEGAVAAYLAAAERVCELAWPLPLPDHMEDELDSPIADLVNAKIGDPAGGSLFAGLFLRRFVGRLSDADDAPRIPWVHLDIAGVGMNKGGGYGFTDKGPTAATVRSLIELIGTRA